MLLGGFVLCCCHRFLKVVAVQFFRIYIMLDIDMAKSLVATFFLRYTHVPTYICMKIHTYNLYPNFLFFFCWSAFKIWVKYVTISFFVYYKTFPTPFSSSTSFFLHLHHMCIALLDFFFIMIFSCFSMRSSYSSKCII